jgi:GAF domain-containing protein
MKRHAPIGADILSTIDFPYPVVPIVRHHHENWDGTGYPDRLRGEAIPVGARILSVVDCFDALTSDRPYRPRLSTAAALEILRERRGWMYDSTVVDAFMRLVDELVVPDEASDAPKQTERMAVSGWVAANGQPMLNADPRLDLQGRMAGSGEPAQSMLAVPVMSNGHPAGVLTLYSVAPSAFSEADLRLVNAVAQPSATGSLFKTGAPVFRREAVLHKSSSVWHLRH